MKITTLTAVTLLLSLVAPTVFAEEPAAAKCEMCEMMKKKAAAQATKEQQPAEMAAQSTELDKLVTEMNSSLGGEKIEAMAAIVTRLVEQSKAAKAPTPQDAPKNEAHQH